MKKVRISSSSLLGAGLGCWFLGPVGALLGFVFGTLAEGISSNLSEYKKESSPRNGFVTSLLVLIAAVMKADGKIVKAELSYVKIYLLQSLGEQQSSQALLMLREILKKEIPLGQVCSQIKTQVDYNACIELVHVLFGVANSDGLLPVSEQNVIQQIALALGISNNDYDSILSMYRTNTNSAYKVLGVDLSSTDDEIKKAYRRMAIKFHPDKIAHLGDEFQASAKVKFQKVNDAFESLKKLRGFN